MTTVMTRTWGDLPARVDEEPAVLRPLLEVEAISARAPDGTVLLDDVGFSLERSWLVAVVGPTGAGKTSLVNALTGALRLQRGSIRLDGEEILGGDPAALRRIGYVPQQDLLHPQLGLRRTLEYAAALRLPTSTGRPERSRRITAVLGELGLERQARVPVSALSGGQRKRANVAVELLGQPDVLVLDEPTSGLDPGYERSVMATLRQLADRGRVVLAVTHSMQALTQCDRVLFLAAGGQLAFFGPPDEAVAYFERSDAADLFLALDDHGMAWKDRFRAHPSYARFVTSWPWRGIGPGRSAAARPARPSDRPPPGRGPQLAILVRRYVDLIRSDRRHLAMLSLQGPVLGLLLWAVLSRHSLGTVPPGSELALVAPGAVTVSVFLAISVTWLGTANAVREIVKESRILRRERGTGLSVSAYVSSKVVVLGALTMVQSAVVTAIACSRQGPPGHGSVLGWGLGEIMVTAALTGLAAVALGLLLSAVVSTPDKALTLLPVALVAQLVFSGAWSSVVATPGLAQLSDLTGAHWGVRAVEATVTGDAGAWWSAVTSLVLLTAGELAAAALLVHRRLRPAWAPRWTMPSLPSGLVSARRPAVRPLFGISAVLLVAAVTATGLRIGSLAPATPTSAGGQVSAMAAGGVGHPLEASTPVQTPATPAHRPAPAASPVVEAVATTAVPRPAPVPTPVVTRTVYLPAASVASARLSPPSPVTSPPVVTTPTSTPSVAPPTATVGAILPITSSPVSATSAMPIPAPVVTTTPTTTPAPASSFVLRVWQLWAAQVAAQAAAQTTGPTSYHSSGHSS